MESQIEIHQGAIPKPSNYTRFVCISDTHSTSISLPPGDVLLHAGDFTRRGTQQEVWDFANYLRNLKFEHKVVIAGNHDSPFDIENYADILNKKRNPVPCDPYITKRLLKDVIYLEDSLAIIKGFRIWGTPWTEQHNKGAFTLKDRLVIGEKWNDIPDNIDILLTHSPPYNILDRSKDNRKVGCESLAAAVRRVRPKVHVFGHIHESHGCFTQNGICYINASICNNRYMPIYRPYVFDLPNNS